jgi:Carboxypeptidase regulatory-like domain
MLTLHYQPKLPFSQSNIHLFPIFFMKKILLFSLVCSLLCLSANVFAQATQTIRGTLLDKESKFPIIGATVSVTTDPANLQGATADENGAFRIEGVKVGRHSLKITSLGYKDITLENIILNSGKETVLDLLMDEAIVEQQTVVITATKQGETRNEMATVSARQFSIEETERYAGSRGDPARMASNFAGVQGADDSRNDIVIRGNSPGSVLWRFEGVDIFNPNHFNIPGTAGGSVTVLNNKWLANSDFFTSAFPADYGNSTSGVFDLRMRNGNNQKYEVSAQLGLLGTELLAEGPLAKNSKASFLVSYRYSTLSVLGNFGINFGTNAIPYYQDAAVRLNFPLKNNAAISVFAVGGKSDIDILVSNKKDTTSELYGSSDRDQYFHSRTGFAGATYSKAFNNNTFTKITLMQSGENVAAEHNLIFRRLIIDPNDPKKKFYQLDSTPKVLRYNMAQSKTGLAWVLNHKFSKKTTFKAGLNADYFTYGFHDTVRTSEFPKINGIDNPAYRQYSIRWNADANAFLVQPYAQVKYQPNEKLTLNAGWHAQYFSLSNSLSAFEPRLGAKYLLPNKQSLTFGAGLHSQMQSSYLYFYKSYERDKGNKTEYNRNMDFTKAAHGVIGYQKIIGDRMLFKAETYYQQLYNVPVDKTTNSPFSLVNTGSGFSRFFPLPLQNTGTGENYGLELTLEKGFSNHFYYMITGSLFEATYKGSDGVKHNTDFNGKYATNGLFSYEFVINKKSTFNVGTKITFAGGRWYGTIDTTASAAGKEVIYKNDNTFNTNQFAPYFRADLKLNYKINTKKLTHEIGIDLVNLLGTKNILRYSWVPNQKDFTLGTTREEYQLGRLPLFYYRVDFGFKPKQ